MHVVIFSLSLSLSLSLPPPPSIPPVEIEAQKPTVDVLNIETGEGETQLAPEPDTRKRHGTGSNFFMQAAEGANKRVKIEKELLQDRLLCVVCQERKRSVVFLPCSHFVLCGLCPGIDECPICRRQVVTRIENVVQS